MDTDNQAFRCIESMNNYFMTHLLLLLYAIPSADAKNKISSVAVASKWASGRFYKQTQMKNSITRNVSLD